MLVVVVGLIAAFGTASGEIKIDESDDILKYVKIEKEFSDDVREALLALEIPAGKEITKDVLEEAFKKSGKLIYVKNDLLQKDSYCSYDLIKSLIVVFKEEELQRFRSFFENYWNEKFQECAYMLRKELINDYENLGSFQSLKEFLNAALPKEKPASEVEYLNILKGVDLNELEKYKTPAATTIVKNAQVVNRDANGTPIVADDDTRFVRFITMDCHFTFYNMRRAVATVNLAQRFKGARGAANKADQLKLDIYNQWNNICWSWLNGGDEARQAIMKNAIKDLNDGSYFISFDD